MSEERDQRKKRKDEAEQAPPPLISGRMQPQPEEKPADEGESGSISLLDLMNEGAEPPRPGRPVAADDQATVTGPAIPAVVPPSEERPAAPPLLSYDQTIAPPPAQHDQDATFVQPRVAFPGQTDLQGRPLRVPPAEVQSPHTQQQPLRQEASRRATPVRERHIAPPRQPSARDREFAAAAAPRAERVDAVYRTAGPQPQPKHRRRGGCLARTLLSLLLLLIAGVLLGTAGTAIAYVAIARDLPSPTELESRASTFETAIIYDAAGEQLYSLADPNIGNRSYVPLDEISPHLINATIATEDARFYSNPGFDPIGIARAVVQAAQEGEFISGASTITQQLVRALLLEEDERTARTFERKVREIVLAAELNRTYPGREGKNKILELYLNEIYYGNLAYGIEAAAQTYFNKPAVELTLAEASLLAGLPQSPAVYDPFTAPEVVLGRQRQVLQLMTQEGYITAEEAQAALDESTETVRNLQPPSVTIRHPHFVFTVLQQLEAQFGAQVIYQGGLRIHTTLDPDTQEMAEAALAEYRQNANNLGANNAALVAIRPGSGEILALVGSFDFRDEDIRGQVNMALAPRQPGSSIKPLVYLSAMEKGWTPGTLIWDVRTEFGDGANPPYVPKNFDDEFHGPVLLRPALGNSYNIPAVKALEFVGVCQFIGNMQKLGLTSLLDQGCLESGQPRDTGLSLALGGREISPLDMATAFSTLANNGLYVEPFAITRITNSRDEVVFEYQSPAGGGQQVARPEHAFLLSDILADSQARQGEFGLNTPLDIPGHAVAVKTGTSGSDADDVRDGWTIGYTPEIVTAVWVGNTDAGPLARGASGFGLATPIWSHFMNAYLANKAAVPFPQPAGVVSREICATSGTLPDENCTQRRTEFFAADQPPLDSEDSFIQRLPVDLWTNRVANAFCAEAIYEANFVNLLVSGAADVLQRETINARQWVEQTEPGRRWASAHNISLPLRLPPAQSCEEGATRPVAQISSPAANASVSGVVEVHGRVNAPNFAGYEVQYGLTHDPGGWAAVGGRQGQPVENGLLASWDTNSINSGGPVTLRLLVFGPDNPYTEENDPVFMETRLPLELLLPTSTPTATPTVTPTPSPTSTASPSPTASPTPTLTPVPLPPTETPTPEGYP